MPIFKDAVREQTATTGTGTLSLAGVVLDGFQRFQDALTTADVVYYEIDDLSIGGTNREVGIGTWTAAGNTLSRDTVLMSTNGGAAVNWGAGTKDVRLSVAATWFTTPICAMIIGGTLVSSDLTFKTTTAVGEAGADMHFLVGNNGATEAMTILNSGNVGIGTTGPTSLLHVAGNANITGTLSAGTFSPSTLSVSGASYLATTSGNVGIGTTSVTRKLEVNGNIGFPSSLVQAAIISDNRLDIQTTSELRLLGGGATIDPAPSVAYAVKMYGLASGNGLAVAGNSIFMNGNVGIGTTGPDRLLHPELADATTNTVSYVQRLSHISSGTVAAGFGAGLEFELETATASTNHLASTLESSWITATAGAEDARFDINVVKASALLAVAPLTVTSAGTAGGVMINKQIFHDAEDANTVSVGNETTVDWTLGNCQKLDLTAEADAITAIFTAPSGPAHLTLRIIQNATARDITWPVTVKWDSDTEPVWTDHDAKTVVLVFYFDGTNYYGALAHLCTT